jgi:hypothetical protein
VGDVTVREHAGRATCHGEVVAWGIAEVSRPTEPECGDLSVVEAFGDGVLIAAIDGSGHGASAAAAARLAEVELRAHAADSPLSLVHRCHEALRQTRGAAMTIAGLDFRDHTLTWLGIGNVEGVLFHETPDEPQRVILRGGVVGYRLPPKLTAETVSLNAFDTLIVATDGIRPDFADQISLEGDPGQIAAGVLSRHYGGTDDALVVVARCLGRGLP